MEAMKRGESHAGDRLPVVLTGCYQQRGTP